MPLILQTLLPATTALAPAAQPPCKVVAVVARPARTDIELAIPDVPRPPAVVEKAYQAKAGIAEIAKQKADFVVAVLRFKKDHGVGEKEACAMVAHTHGHMFPALRKRGMSFPTFHRAKQALTDYREVLHPEWWEDLLRQTHNCGRKAEPIDPPFLQAFNLSYLSKHHVSIQAAWDAAGMALGLRQEEMPDVKRLEAYVRTIPKTVKMKARANQAAYENYAGGYVLRRWNTIPGAVWISDHRRLDLWIKVGMPDGSSVAQRPWCTVFEDAASGYMVACVIYVDAEPNHAKILESLWRGIRANGGVPPLFILTDNGKDYKKQGAFQDLEFALAADTTNDALGVWDEEDGPEKDRDEMVRTSVARSLGIEVFRAKPHQGRQKPVERMFRNFATRFDPLVIGYTGRSVEHKVEYDQKVFKGNIDRLLTLQQLIDFFDGWVSQIYHVSAGKRSRITGGKTPHELWSARVPQRAALTAEQLDYAMLLPHRNLMTVRRGPTGSSVYFMNWPYGGTNAEDIYKLKMLHDREVLVKTSWATETVEFGHKRLPLRVWIFMPDGRLVCEVRPVEEVTVFGTSPEKAALMERTSRLIALGKGFDQRGRQNLLGGRTREMAPSSVIGISQGGMFDSPAANIAGSLVPGPGRGKLKVAREDQVKAEIAEARTQPVPAALEISAEEKAAIERALFGRSSDPGTPADAEDPNPMFTDTDFDRAFNQTGL